MFGPSHVTLSTSSSHIALRTQVPEVLSPSDLHKLLERDFSECVDSDQKMAQEDFRFIKVVEGNIKRCEDKHYEMPLPFRDDPSALSNNRIQALAR